MTVPGSDGPDARPLDLLVVNPPSTEFFHVPMGSFAICDYLSRQGYSAKIVNLSHWPRATALAQLDALVFKYRPRHLGLILHWKELLNSFVAVGARLRRTAPDVPIWAGGITAGFYAKELLRRCPFIDGVVKGDAELPLLRLCQDAPVRSIPNLWLRTDQGPAQPTATWVADRGFLDALRYGNLDFVVQPQVYLELLAGRLGFPLAVGRGCVFDCGYCGGSRQAFLEHSNRARLAVRGARHVVDDIQLAMSHGAQYFLLSHLPGTASAILHEIRARFGRKPPFSMNLEVWGPLHRDLIDLYATFEWPVLPQRRHLLLTLRGSADPDTRRRERIDTLNAARYGHEIDENLSITIFSGYFAPWHISDTDLDEELAFAYRARREFASSPAHFSLMAFSTDPGSQWSRGIDGMTTRLGLPSIARESLLERSVTNNLLLHRPGRLAPATEGRFLAAWHLDNSLLAGERRVWDVLTAALSFVEYREILARAAKGLYHGRNGHVFLNEPLSSVALLGALLGGLENITRDDRRELIEEYVTLQLAGASVRKGSPVSLPPQGADLPPVLMLDPEVMIRLDFDFDPIFDCQRVNKPLRAEVFEEVMGRRGAYGYLLRPHISSAQPKAEIELLETFDGLTSTEHTIRDLAARLKAPKTAIEARVLELYEQGILVSYFAA